jgi:twitching motility protein PilI
MSTLAYQTPFEVLLEYEAKSLSHAVGLPETLEAEGLWRGIAFRVSASYLVAGIGEVNEILTIPSMTNVPGARSWLLGIANVRGNLVAVVDLKGFLAGQRTVINDRCRLLVITQGNASVGLLVDEILGQKTFNDSHRVELTQVEESLADYIEGGYRQDGRDWGVFALEQLLHSPVFINAAA